MMLRFAKVLLLSLFPLAGMAQTLPSLVPASNDGRTPLVDELLALDSHGQPMLTQGAPVLPIWSGSNGQLLAIVALPREWTTSPLSATPAYGGPSDWHLVGSAAASAGGVRWQFNDGLRAEATLGQYLSAASMPCTADTCGSAATSHWSHGSLTAALGMGWSTADGGLDLSYGLSWLQSQGTPATLGSLASAGSALVPVLTLPNAQNFTLDSETSVYARGRWQFGSSGQAFDVAASYGRGRASAIGSTPTAFGSGIDLDQLSLSLGMDAGSLRGAIVGHVLSSDDPMLAGKRWTTLDLGVSWRTPWSGELSVGAQNLLSAPLSASPREAESQQTRTPYIQYRQDL